MKIRLLTVSLSAALLVAGCGKNQTAANSAAAASSTPASTGAPAAGPSSASPSTSATAATTPAATPAAKAGEARTIEITANDQMKFNLATIEAKPGEQLKIVLKNTGTLPKEAMGHNWVLLKKGSDAAAFATAAVAAKAQDYVPENLRNQVVAYTKLIGPKQTDEVTFTVPSEAGEYPYLCSFPAHFIVGMKGNLIVK